jgi:TRAP-type uncharacterized transport system substrate-binding protein
MGCMEAPKLVGEGAVDMAFTTPAWWARASREGKTPFATTTELRAIINFPHNDRLAFVLRKELGITSLEQIREEKRPLRLVTAPPGILHPGGWGVEKVLEAYGFSLQDIESWGGEVKWKDRQYDKAQQLVRGDIDGIFDEAVNTWAGEASEHVALEFLPIGSDVLPGLEERYGMRPLAIEAGRFPGQDRDIVTIDYRGHLVFCRADLPDEVAYYAVRAVDRAQDKVRALHEAKKYMQDEYCSLDMRKVCRDTEISLHPGAEAYYREHGYL